MGEQNTIFLCNRYDYDAGHIQLTNNDLERMVAYFGESLGRIPAFAYGSLVLQYETSTTGRQTILKFDAVEAPQLRNSLTEERYLPRTRSWASRALIDGTRYHSTAYGVNELSALADNGFLSSDIYAVDELQTKVMVLNTDFGRFLASWCSNYTSNKPDGDHMMVRAGTLPLAVLMAILRKTRPNDEVLKCSCDKVYWRKCVGRSDAYRMLDWIKRRMRPLDIGNAAKAKAGLGYARYAS
mgnify:CR=1 FL=1